MFPLRVLYLAPGERLHAGLYCHSPACNIQSSTWNPNCVLTEYEEPKMGSARVVAQLSLHAIRCAQPHAS